MTGERDLTIRQGETFQFIVRWETKPLVYKPITDITAASPAVVTCLNHGVPDGWNVAVVSAGGMRQINAEHWPLRESDFVKATAVDSDTLKLNDVNSADYTAYTSGGSVVYYTPVDLAGFSARMQIRAALASDTPLLSLTSDGAPPLTGIQIDNLTKTVLLTISATDTAALDFLTGVYDLELVSPQGVVTRVMSGNVVVSDEATR